MKLFKIKIVQKIMIIIIMKIFKISKIWKPAIIQQASKVITTTNPKKVSKVYQIIKNHKKEKKVKIKT